MLNGRVEINALDDGEKITLHKEALEALAGATNEIVMNFSGAQIIFDSNAVDTIYNTITTERICISLEEIPEDHLSRDQFRVVSALDIERIISASILTEAGEIHDFGGGVARITIPIGIENGVKYEVIYIAEDGSIEKMDSTVTDDGIEFTTTHFSSFAIVKVSESNRSYVTVGACIALAVIATIAAVSIRCAKRKKR